MKKFLPQLFIFLLMFNVFSAISFADEMFDESFDKEVRQKYNTKAIENDLPKLQNNMPSQTVFSPSYSQPSQKEILSTAIKVDAGRTFKVYSMQAVSDATPKGTRLTFVSIYPEPSSYITIPAGTVFKGAVVDSHRAGLFGNGGLIVIRVNELIYKNVSYPIVATISMANNKHIFFNNIKGKRQYLKNAYKITKPGQKFMGKMWGVTLDLARGFPEVLLTPVSLLSGAAVWTGNVLISPVLAIFSKGGPISIPKGAEFRIKLQEDMLVVGQ